jgi:hypothetical protein
MECSICLEAISASTGKAEMSCGHPYHLKCLVNWLVKCDSCPLCRGKPSEFESLYDLPVQQDTIPDELTLTHERMMYQPIYTTLNSFLSSINAINPSRMPIEEDYMEGYMENLQHMFGNDMEFQPQLESVYDDITIPLAANEPYHTYPIMIHLRANERHCLYNSVGTGSTAVIGPPVF